MYHEPARADTRIRELPWTLGAVVDDHMDSDVHMRAMKNFSNVHLAGLLVASAATGALVATSVSPSRAQPSAVTGSVCVEISGINSLRNLNQTIARQEAMGYELTTFAAPAIPCFRRR